MRAGEGMDYGVCVHWWVGRRRTRGIMPNQDIFVYLLRYYLLNMLLRGSTSDHGHHNCLPSK